MYETGFDSRIAVSHDIVFAAIDTNNLPSVVLDYLGGAKLADLPYITSYTNTDQEPRIDHDTLFARLPEMGLPEFVAAFTLYTQSVFRQGELLRARSGIVVNSVVRDDLSEFFATGAHLLSGLQPEQAANVYRTIAENFSPGRLYGNTKANNSIHTMRNTLYDILEHPDSLTDGVQNFAVNLFSNLMEVDVDSIKQTYLKILQSPIALTNNPEMLFLFSEYAQKYKLNLPKIRELCGAMVPRLIRLAARAHGADSYQAKLDQVYFDIADRQFSGSDSRKKPSDGNLFYSPNVLVAVAQMVAKATPGEQPSFQPTRGDSEFSKAFDYLLPVLELGAVWPELEPETILTVETAYSQFVNMLA